MAYVPCHLVSTQKARLFKRPTCCAQIAAAAPGAELSYDEPENDLPRRKSQRMWVKATCSLVFTTEKLGYMMGKYSYKWDVYIYIYIVISHYKWDIVFTILCH